MQQTPDPPYQQRQHWRQYEGVNLWSRPVVVATNIRYSHKGQIEVSNERSV